LSSVYVVNSPGPVDLPTAGGYAVRFENINGQPIATFPFEPDHPSEAGDQATFNLMLPWDNGTKRITILHDGVPVISRQASANAPTVTVTSPNGGEILTGPTANLTWTSADADGETLNQIIQYSSDGGTTWRVLATDVTTNSYTLDLTTIPGSAQALIRVIASDGINTSQDQSNATFTVPAHAPEATISLPPNDSMFVGEQTIILRGSGYDAEDGLLPNARLTWTSNLNGAVGTGSSVSFDATSLQEGTHTITLTATDSSGQSGTSTRTIRVFRSRPVLPAALAVSSARLSYVAIYGSPIPPQTLSISNSGDGILTWTATSDQPSIQLDLGTGMAPSSINVSVDPSGLNLGVNTGRITITPTGGTASPKIVDVTLILTPGSTSTISSRVTTPTGIGLRNAHVTLISSQGVSRSTTTSSFGVFSFSGVANGDTYTISISSKRYRFAPRITRILTDLNLADFVGLE